MNSSNESDPPPHLDSKRKLSSWAKLGGGPLTFAVIFHVVALAIGAFWIFQIIRQPEKKVDFIPPVRGERGAEHPVENRKPAQLPPSASARRLAAEGVASTMTIPEPGDGFVKMSPLSALGNPGLPGGQGLRGGGPDMPFDEGILEPFDRLPELLGKRCSKEDRLQRLAENGGTKDCEDAVLKGLRWLKTKQAADGSWDGPSRVAMTGLALLAYFGHCETPASTEFGESSMRAIVYLVNIGAKNNGRIADNFAAGNWSYEHAIATYALGEATTFCKEVKQPVPSLAEVTEKAGQFIIDNQHGSGGWSYKYEREGGHPDLSITGW
ncbi:MAG: hypothetical protein NTW21_43850, partial [Verrucomicrobia bacterium]|nr:hypothetical protein [Verrucomicrobiota bacterium]